MLLDDLRLQVLRQVDELLSDRGTRVGEESFAKRGIRHRSTGPAPLEGDPARHLIGQGHEAH